MRNKIVLAAILILCVSSLVSSQVLKVDDTKQMRSRGGITSSAQTKDGAIVSASFQDTTLKASLETVNKDPVLRLERWGGDAYLDITYHFEAQTVDSSVTTDDVISYTDGLIDYNLLPTKTADGDSAMEINLILYDKPKNNVFTFDVGNADKFDFYQQPEGLTDELTGSYAVYSKTLRNNQYGTGKAFQIFRPLVTDDKGATTWATLKYDSGVLSVEVPEDFLDNAAYPVVVDPILGYSTVCSAGSRAPANNKVEMSCWVATEDGIITSTTWRLSTGTSNAQDAKLGIYFKNSSSLYTLLDSAMSSQVPGYGTTWVTASINNVKMEIGQTYCMGAQGSNPAETVCYDWSASHTDYENYSAVPYPNLPTKVGTPTNSFSNEQYSAYATYTATPPNITLDSPSNATRWNYYIPPVNFSYTFNGNNTQNVTLQVWNSTGGLEYTNYTACTVTNNVCTVNTSITLTHKDTYLWNALAWTNRGINATYPSNYTLFAYSPLTYNVTNPINAASYSHDITIPFTVNTTSSYWPLVNVSINVTNTTKVTVFSYTNTSTTNGTKYLGTSTFTYADSPFNVSTTTCDNVGHCETAYQLTFNSLNYAPTISTYYPANNSAIQTPINISVTIASSDPFANVTFYAWNATTTWNFTNNTASTGVFLFQQGIQPNGIVNWNATACDIDKDCTTTGRLNYTIQTTTISSTDTTGGCLTYKGWGYIASVGASENKVQLDFTAMNDTVTANLSNVVIEGGNSAWKYNNWSMVVDTTDPSKKSFVVWVGGFDGNQSYSTSTPTIDKRFNLTLSQMSLTNYAYTVILKNEETDNLANVTNASVEEIKALCTNYAPTAINVTTSQPYYIFITKEASPTFQVRYTRKLDGTTQIRRISADTVSQNVTLYQSETKKMTTCNFALNDYTGTYRAAGKLRISTKVVSNLVPIHSEKWYFGDINAVYLQNNTDYMVESYVPNGAVYNFGWITATDGCTQTLIITNPPLTSQIDHYGGLYYAPLSDPTTNMVGFSYNFSQVSTQVNSINFTVSNNTDNIYSVIATTQSGTFTYIVPSQRQTYRVTVIMDISGHSILSAQWAYNFWNTTAILRNITVPDFFEYTGQAGHAKVQTFIVWGSFVFLALLASPATYTTVGIVMIAAAGVYYLMGWINGFLPIILISLITLLLAKVVQSRETEGY
jgi:hypothetical protein